MLGCGTKMLSKSIGWFFYIVGFISTTLMMFYWLELGYKKIKSKYFNTIQLKNGLENIKPNDSKKVLPDFEQYLKDEPDVIFNDVKVLDNAQINVNFKFSIFPIHIKIKNDGTVYYLNGEYEMETMSWFKYYELVIDLYGCELDELDERRLIIRNSNWTDIGEALKVANSIFKNIHAIERLVTDKNSEFKDAILYKATKAREKLPFILMKDSQ